MKIFDIVNHSFDDEKAYYLEFFHLQESKGYLHEKCLFKFHYINCLDEFEYRGSPWFSVYFSFVSWNDLFFIQFKIKGISIGFHFFADCNGSHLNYET